MGKSKSLKQRVYEYIANERGVSYCQLEEKFGEEFKGELTVGWLEKNIIFWIVSKQFNDCLKELIEEGLIRIKPCHVPK